MQDSTPQQRASTLTSERYVIGLDFGTESGRAVLVRTRDGRIAASAVYKYPDGVIDTRLPGGGADLPPDWTLQNPRDLLSVVSETVQAVIRRDTGMVPEPQGVYRPIAANCEWYNYLYADYHRLVDMFGRDESSVLRRLHRLRTMH